MSSGPRFAVLDVKLAAAINKISTGEIGRKIHQVCDRAINKENRVAKGRELLWIIMDYYSTGHAMESLYSTCLL